MGIKRIVDTSFWTDGKVDEFSPEDKYFMLYLLTNPFTTQLGIYEISVKQVAFQLGYSIESVNVLLDRFENKYGMILYSKETHEIGIKNFLRHSIIKGGKPVEDCIKKEMSKVKNKNLITAIFGFIATKDDLNDTVRKIINEYENEIHNENDNDNDNENDVSYHDSYNVSYHDSLKPTHTHTSNDIYSDLINKYGKAFVDERVERAKSYKNISMEKIAQWCEEDFKKQPQKKKNQFNNFPPQVIVEVAQI